MTTERSEVDPLDRVVIKHARDAFADQGTIDRQWRALNYTSRPDLEKAVDEYDRFLELLERLGCNAIPLPREDKATLDSIYTRDTAVVAPSGVILGSMGKAERRREPAILESFLRSEGIPILGQIAGEGRLEGGDVVWLDARTLAVGRGYRTNDEGIAQLGRLLGDDVELVVVPLPHWNGPADVFHLMSIISPLDRDLALVHSPLMPVPFRERLLSMGMELIEVAQDEYASLGCNVLAVAPRVCVMVSGNTRTRARLEEHGVDVHVFDGNEICIKGSGGPTCLTLPLLRRPAV